MGRGDEGIAPYRNAGRPQHVGATLVVARPAVGTSVGADAHIRPLLRGSRSGTLGIGQNGRPYRPPLQEHRAAQTHGGASCGRPPRRARP